VATRVGSVPDLVTSGRNGYLVAAGDSRGMAALVLELLGDRDRAATLGRAGREFVLAHGSVARMVEGYQNLIADIYAAKCRRHAAANEPSADAPTPLEGTVGNGEALRMKEMTND
jgi:hypothetical protein